MDWSSVESNAETIENTEYEEEESTPEEEQEETIDPRELLTKEQLQYFREIFDTFDVHNKGVIPVKTIGYVLRILGQNPTKADIKKHIEDIDPENKGLINFYSFLLPIAQRMEQEPETPEDIIAAFEVLDEDGSGFLTSDQLYDFLTTHGEDLEDFEIELLLKMADSKGTGRVYYRDFVEKMMGVVRKNPKEDKKKKKKK